MAVDLVEVRFLVSTVCECMWEHHWYLFRAGHQQTFGVSVQQATCIFRGNLHTSHLHLLYLQKPSESFSSHTCLQTWPVSFDQAALLRGSPSRPSLLRGNRLNRLKCLLGRTGICSTIGLECLMGPTEIWLTFTNWYCRYHCILSGVLTIFFEQEPRLSVQLCKWVW